MSAPLKLLLLGKNGQLGWELQRSLAPLGEVVALGRDDGLDLADASALMDIVYQHQPQIIVNAAAYTAVDKAESEPDLAMAINGAAPAVLGTAAADLGALLVHYSSDYVLNGEGEAPHDEDALLDPLSAYGNSKAAGEMGVLQSGCVHLILRTSWVYAARGGNFARTMLRLAAEREELRVVSDQIGAPTGADLLADVTAHLVRLVPSRPQLAGLYHVTAAGETSWHGYAQHVIEQARARGAALRVAPDRVLPIPTADYPTPAPRPQNSRLSTERLRQTFGLNLPPWQQGVERMLAEILPG